MRIRSEPSIAGDNSLNAKSLDLMSLIDNFLFKLASVDFLALAELKESQS